MGYWSGIGAPTLERSETAPVHRGARYDHSRRFWSLDEDRLLIKLRCGGIKPELVAELTGRGVNAVWSRTYVLQRAGVITRKPGLRWEFEAAPDLEERLASLHQGRRLRGTGQVWDLSGDQERVADLAMEGMSAREIAKEMGGRRTVQAVAACLVRLRQSGEVPSACRPWRGVGTDGEPYDDIKQLHLDFYAGYSDEMIAKRLNRTASAVIRKRRQRGLKRSFQGLPKWG